MSLQCPVSERVIELSWIGRVLVSLAYPGGWSAVFVIWNLDKPLHTLRHDFTQFEGVVFALRHFPRLCSIGRRLYIRAAHSRQLRVRGKTVNYASCHLRSKATLFNDSPIGKLRILVCVWFPFDPTRRSYCIEKRLPYFWKKIRNAHLIQEIWFQRTTMDIHSGAKRIAMMTQGVPREEITKISLCDWTLRMRYIHAQVTY